MRFYCKLSCCLETVSTVARLCSTRVENLLLHLTSFTTEKYRKDWFLKGDNLIVILVAKSVGAETLRFIFNHGMVLLGIASHVYFHNRRHAPAKLKRICLTNTSRYCLDFMKSPHKYVGLMLHVNARSNGMVTMCKILQIAGESLTMWRHEWWLFFEWLKYNGTSHFEWAFDQFGCAKTVATELVVIRMSRPFTPNRLLTGLCKLFFYMVLNCYAHVFQPYLGSSPYRSLAVVGTLSLRWFDSAIILSPLAANAVDRNCLQRLRHVDPQAWCFYILKCRRNGELIN